MTLEEAISYLEELSRQPWLQPFKHFLAAIKLGIEALKREQHYRSMNQPCYHRPLPGETKD